MSDTFRAVLIEDVDGKPKAAFRQLKLSDLPQHDMLVEVAYSTLNYKDGLALTGGRIARKLPMIGGIDIAGTRSEEHTSELQSLMRISYAVFCLKKKKNKQARIKHTQTQQ